MNARRAASSAISPDILSPRWKKRAQGVEERAIAQCRCRKLRRSHYRRPKFPSAALLAELVRLRKELLEAELKGNKEALERLLTDDYITRTGDETRSKAQLIEQASSGSRASDSPVSWSVDDASLIRRSEEQTTLMSTLKVEYSSQGRQIIQRERAITIFEKQQGNWRARLNRSSKT